jgi:hypothetical protein
MTMPRQQKKPAPAGAADVPPAAAPSAAAAPAAPAAPADPEADEAVVARTVAGLDSYIHTVRGRGPGRRAVGGRRRRLRRVRPRRRVRRAAGSPPPAAQPTSNCRTTLGERQR